MYRYRELLMSFLASAMVTTGLMPVPAGISRTASVLDPAAASRALGLVMAVAPQGVSPVAVGIAAGAPAPTLVTFTSGGASIDPARFQALVRVAMQANRITPMTPRLCAPLNLTTPDAPFPSRQYSITGQQTGILHIVAVHDPSADSILFMRRDGTSALAWATDAVGRPLSAVRVANGVLTVVPVDQAMPSFLEEMALWADPTTPLAQPTQVAAASPAS
jgi:hypothetical protein